MMEKTMSENLTPGIIRFELLTAIEYKDNEIKSRGIPK
jgi:hypothetical protein